MIGRIVMKLFQFRTVVMIGSVVVAVCAGHTMAAAKTYFEQSIVKDDKIVAYLQDDEKDLKGSKYSAVISGKRKGEEEEADLGTNTNEILSVKASNELTHYIFLLDKSKSVDASQYKDAVSQVKAFQKKIKGTDKITLYTIGNVDKKGVGKEVKDIDKIEGLKRDAENTVLYNTINYVIKENADNNERTVVILLSDGIDDSKDKEGKSHSDLYTSVRENVVVNNPTIPLYGILLKNSYHTVSKENEKKIEETKKLLGMGPKDQMKRGFDATIGKGSVRQAFKDLCSLMWDHTYEVAFDQPQINLEDAGFKDISDADGEKVSGKMALPELPKISEPEEPESTPEKEEQSQSITIVEEESGLSIGWIILIAVVAILGIVLAIIIYRRKSKIIHVDVDPEELSKSDSVPVRIVITDENGVNHEGNWVIEGSFFVGRSEICGLCIDDDLLSKQHFVIEITKSGCFVRDLDSTNGTSVNGVKLEEPRRLVDGDVISAGREKFTFYREEA